MFTTFDSEKAENGNDEGAEGEDDVDERDEDESDDDDAVAGEEDDDETTAECSGGERSGAKGRNTGTRRSDRRWIERSVRTGTRS